MANTRVTVEVISESRDKPCVINKHGDGRLSWLTETIFKNEFLRKKNDPCLNSGDCDMTYEYVRRGQGGVFKFMYI